MAGVQKLFYLPEPHTDFIYAVIGEELGLIGATTTLVLLPDRVARSAHHAARAGRVWRIRGAWHDHHDRGAGIREHERGLGLMPTKGIPLLW